MRLEGAGGPRRSRLLCVLLAQHEALSEYRPLVSQAHQLQRRTSAADKKLALIPLIFVCLRIWSTVRFVLTLCGSPAVRTPVLVVLHVGLPRPRPAPLSRLPADRGGQQGQIPVPGRQAGGGSAPPRLARCPTGSLDERRWKVSVARGQPGGVELLSSGLGVAPGELTDPESFPAQKTRGHACKSRPARCSAQGPRGQGPPQTSLRGGGPVPGSPALPGLPACASQARPGPGTHASPFLPARGSGTPFRGAPTASRLSSAPAPSGLVSSPSAPAAALRLPLPPRARWAPQGPCALHNGRASRRGPGGPRMNFQAPELLPP